MTQRPAPADQPIRDQALDPAKSFIVQAPAGSGKTELLVTRFVTLLAVVDYPEQILAITFTIKAAQEMRQRVLEALSSNPSNLSPALAQAAQLAAQSDHRMQWQLSANPSRLRIMTIDSFNRHLIQRAPVQSELNRSEKISLDNSMYRKAASKMLSQLQEKAAPGDKIAALDRVFSHFGCDGDSLENALVQMLSSREQWLELFTGIRDMSEEDARDWLNEQLYAEAEQVSDRFNRALSPWLEQIVTTARKVAALPDADSALHTQINIIAGGLPDALADAMEFWQSIQQWLLTAKLTIRKTLDKRQGFPTSAKELKTATLELLGQMAAAEHSLGQLLPPTSYSSEQIRVILDFANTFVEAAAWLELVFAEHKTIDFSGVGKAALDSLGSDDQPALVAELEYERIYHILIDEFQDTSNRQYELLRRMVREWSSNHDRHSLFIVGDPKQSIYRFRQAEPSLFARIWRHGIAGIQLERLELKSNFRSNADLVEWCNRSFSSLFPQSPEYAIGETSYSSSEAEVSHRTKQPVQLFLSDKKADAEGTINARLVEEILSLQARQDIHSIAILVSKRKHAVRIVQQLQQKKIACTTTDLESIDEQQHVIDLLSLAKALSDLDDSISWLALLRHPVLALSLADSLILCEQEGTLWQTVSSPPAQLSEDGKAIVDRVRKALSPLIGRVRRSPWRQLVEDAWHQLTIAQQLNDEQYDQCLALLELIEQYSQGIQIDFQSLAANLAQLKHSVTTVNSMAGRNKPVSIMTIHKAKGLEFDAVLVPALDDSLVKTSGRPPFLWNTMVRDQHSLLLLATTRARSQSEQDKLYLYLSNLEKRKNLAEALRVLYVAFTRARICLRLFSRVSDKQQKEDGESYIQWLLHRTEVPTVVVEAGQVEQQQQSLPVLVRSRPEGEKTQMPTRKISESPAVETEQPPIVWHHSLEDRLPGMQGTEIHYLLEQLHHKEMLASVLENRQSCADFIDQQKHGWQTTLRLRGIPYRYRNSVCEQTIKAIENTLNDPIGRWIFSRQDAQAELSLQTRDQHKAIITRIIDCTFVDEDVRWIIDYKAVMPTANETEQAFTSRIKQQYQPQLEHYAAIFRKRETRPIMLGLYLVLQPLWIHWHWQEEQPESDSHLP